MFGHSLWVNCLLLYIRRLSQIGEKKIYADKTSADCSLVPPKDAMPPKFVEKTFTKSNKPQKFSPSKVFHYTVFGRIPSSKIGLIRLLKLLPLGG